MFDAFAGVPPAVLAAESVRFAREMTRIALGTSDVEPDPADRRFRDPTWTENRFARPVMQAYLAWAEGLQPHASQELLRRRSGVAQA